MVTTRNEIQLMVQIARLYYDGGLTQQQIAKRLDMTRQRVSRLLVAAREEGIVRISIFDPTPADPHLKEQLLATFGLHDVVLASTEGLEANELRSQLGLVAAEYLINKFTNGMKVGVGWGRTLYEMVNSISHTRQVSAHIVPIIGGIGDMSPFFQINELARKLAEAISGTFRYIYAPAFTKDTSILKSLSKTQEVEQLQEIWKSLDLAIIGVGHVEFQHLSSMYFADHISPRALAQLETAGAVGDVCGRFINSRGETVSGGNGVMGISLEQLQAIPEVVAIAGGVEKTRAMLGALRGGFIKTLITDTVTARAMLLEFKERR